MTATDTRKTLDPSSNPKGRLTRLKRFLPLVLVLVGSIALWRLWPRSPSPFLELSGRLEGYPTNVDAKVQGRIETITVREGQSVQQGQMIAELDAAELEAQLTGAQARHQAARERERQAQLQLSVIQSQIREVTLLEEQAASDSSGRVAQAEANLAAAQAQAAQTRAQLQQSLAQLQLAANDRDRIAALYQSGAVSAQANDQAVTTLNASQATVDSLEAAFQAAQRQVSAADGNLVQARSQAMNPAIRAAQMETLQRQLEVAQAELTAARAEVENAAAAVVEVQARLQDLHIVSPISGVVLTRSLEPGTVVSPGATLLTVIDPAQVYLRGFIPQGDIGRVRVGQAARVYLDAFPNQPLEASVRAVDAEASFTPENIYFKEDRVRQVFGVELKLEDAAGFAKPGMPADGEILLDSGPAS